MKSKNYDSLRGKVFGFAGTGVLAVLLCFWIPKSVIAQENLVPNPGLEEGTSAPIGWKPHHKFTRGWIEHSKAEWASDEVHSGEKSIKITIDKIFGPTLDWSSVLIPLKGDTKIKVSCWMKTKNVTPGVNEYKVPNVLLRCYDSSGKMVKQYWFARCMVRDSDWTLYQRSISLPEQVTSVQIRAGLSACTGTAWFDDFEIVIEEEITQLSSLMETVSADTISDALTTPIIIPLPWKEEYGKDNILLDNAKIVHHDPTKDIWAIEELKDFLKDLVEEEPEILPAGSDLSSHQSLILIGKNLLIKEYLKRLNIKVDWTELGPQGYLLAVKRLNNQNIIILTGNREVGVYYAVQSLKQYPVKKDNQYLFQEGVIRDKPSYELRGLILGGSWDINRIDRWMKPLKGNIVFCPHDSSSWDKPFTSEQKSSFKTFLLECQKRFITPVVGTRPDRGYIRRIEYSNEKDIQIVKDKYRDFYECGYRNFYLCLDDGPQFLLYPEDKKRFRNIAEAHYYLIETIYQHLKTLDPKNKLWVCLLHYGNPLEWVLKQKEYLSYFSKLPGDIEFFNTGAVTTERALEHLKVLGRKPFIWDNWVARFEREKPIPSVVPPPNVKNSKDLVEHVTGYVYPLLDKDMMWYFACNYMWNASRYEPAKAATKIMAKVFGRNLYKELADYQQFISKNRDLPLKGDTKNEKISSARELIINLNKYSTNLKSSLPAQIWEEIRTTVKNKTMILEKVIIPQLTEKPLPVYVPFTHSAARIDGDLNEECWKKALKLAGFNLLLSQGERYQATPAKEQTEVLIVYNKKNLYLGFVCYESLMDSLKALVKERDSTVYADDCIEVFLDVERTGNGYYHFAVNSIGTVYDARVFDDTWNSEVLIGTKKKTDRWIVEMAVPLECLGNSVVLKGKRWNFNFCRARYAGKREFSTWAIVIRGFHEPERFWTLEFGGESVD